MSNLNAAFVTLPVVARALPPSIKSSLAPVKSVVRQVRRIPSAVREAVQIANTLPVVTTLPYLSLNYAYDLKRFLDWSAVGGRSVNQANLQAQITMDYHRLEKGLALREPRLGFGTQVIERLIANLYKYQTQYGLDDIGQVAINTLSAYYKFHLDQGMNYEYIQQAIATLRATSSKDENCSLQGGIIEIKKEEICQAGKLDLKSFFDSRYSIRQFSSEDVDLSLIQQAVVMAQKTPSVCNRQSAKVYVFSREEDKQKVLSYQNGNRGFGEQINKVLIVTSDLQHFMTAGERNQCWVDGGMFAMSLVYALHSLGLGSCCLNWSVQYCTDRELRQVAGIPESEVVMMMIGVGHLPEKLTVAQSPRKSLAEVLVIK
jgi:nitroreductase